MDTGAGQMGVLDLIGSMGEIQMVCGSESGGFGFSQYRIAPERTIQRITDDLSFRHAAAAGCSCGCTCTGMKETNVGPGDVVLVAGVGFIGFGTIINARYRVRLSSRWSESSTGWTSRGSWEPRTSSTPMHPTGSSRSTR